MREILPIAVTMLGALIMLALQVTLVRESEEKIDDDFTEGDGGLWESV